MSAGEVRIDAVEVWGVRNLLDSDAGETECEPILPEDPTPPDFWSVYQHVDGEGCFALTDHPSRVEAIEAGAALALRLGVPFYDYTVGTVEEGRA